MDRSVGSTFLEPSSNAHNNIDTVVYSLISQLEVFIEIGAITRPESMLAVDRLWNRWNGTPRATPAMSPIFAGDERAGNLYGLRHSRFNSVHILDRDNNHGRSHSHRDSQHGMAYFGARALHTSAGQQAGGTLNAGAYATHLGQNEDLIQLDDEPKALKKERSVLRPPPGFALDGQITKPINNHASAQTGYRAQRDDLQEARSTTSLGLRGNGLPGPPPPEFKIPMTAEAKKNQQWREMNLIAPGHLDAWEQDNLTPESAAIYKAYKEGRLPGPVEPPEGHPHREPRPAQEPFWEKNNEEQVLNIRSRPDAMTSPSTNSQDSASSAVIRARERAKARVRRATEKAEMEAAAAAEEAKTRVRRAAEKAETVAATAEKAANATEAVVEQVVASPPAPGPTSVPAPAPVPAPTSTSASNGLTTSAVSPSATSIVTRPESAATAEDTAPARAPAIINPGNIIICPYWLTRPKECPGRHCRYGFIHELVPDATQERLECWFWANKGFCNRQDTCELEHKSTVHGHVMREPKFQEKKRKKIERARDDDEVTMAPSYKSRDPESPWRATNSWRRETRNDTAASAEDVSKGDDMTDEQKAWKNYESNGAAADDW